MPGYGVSAKNVNDEERGDAELAKSRRPRGGGNSRGRGARRQRGKGLGQAESLPARRLTRSQRDLPTKNGSEPADDMDGQDFDLTDI